MLEAFMTTRALVGGLILTAGTAFCIFSANAADLPPAPRMAPVAPVVYAPAVYNWTGIYVGGHLGGGYANSSWSDPFTGASDDFNSGVGFLGGAQVGANYQINALVLGVEGDFSWTDLKGSGTDSIGNTLQTNTQWTSTVTGRVGAAFDRLLVYGKGGLAFAQDQSSLIDLGGNTATNSFVRTGWTVGAGLEYAFARNWSAKVEYDYLGFGTQSMNFTTPVLGTVTSNASLNVQEVKAGVNFHFGGP
jgi:outer membrane immunogenic protein